MLGPLSGTERMVVASGLIAPILAFFSATLLTIALPLGAGALKEADDQPGPEECPQPITEGGGALGDDQPTGGVGDTPQAGAGLGCTAPPAPEFGRGGVAGRGTGDVALGDVAHAPWPADPTPAAVLRTAAACALVWAARIAALSSGVGSKGPRELGIVAVRCHCAGQQGR